MKKTLPLLTALLLLASLAAAGDNTIAGKAVDACGPLAGAQVSLEGPAGCFLATTDQEGAYCLDQLPDGIYSLNVGGGADAEPVLVSVGAGEEVRDVQMEGKAAAEGPRG